MRCFRSCGIEEGGDQPHRGHRERPGEGVPVGGAGVPGVVREAYRESVMDYIEATVKLRPSAAFVGELRHSPAFDPLRGEPRFQQLLSQAEASLATGDSDGIDEELVRAEEALSGRTRLDVEAAREALAREDLLPAREMLAAALAENRVRR